MFDFAGRCLVTLLGVELLSVHFSWSGMIVAVLMIHTPLAGDSTSTCLPANSLPSEICPLAPMDLTVGPSEIWFDMPASNHAFMPHDS